MVQRAWRWLLAIAFILGLVPLAAANQAATGFCTAGNQPVVVSGLTSTNVVQGSFPQCIVTVNVVGSGLATIFADNVGTPLANPFTATSGGQWTFYAVNGRYAVTLSGFPVGVTPTSVTFSDILLFDPATGTIPFTNLSLSGNLSVAGNTTLSNGGSLAGTFAGSPIFSGSPTFSSTTAFNSLATFSAGITGTGNIGALDLGSGALADTHTWSGTQNFAILTASGAVSFTGGLTANSVNNVVYADLQSGADCGARINSASSVLAGPGEIMVSGLCGMGTASSPGSAVTISTAGQDIKFIQSGTYYFTSFTIDGIGSTISSLFPCSIGDPLNPATNHCAVILKQGNGLNGAVFMNLEQPQDGITDITLDGNKANNTTTVGLQYNNQREFADRISVQNFPGDGVQAVGGAVGDNNAIGSRFFLSESMQNGGNGYFCTATTDLILLRSEFENNADYGVNWLNCASARIFNNDWSNNTEGGFHASVNTTNFNFFNQFNQIIGNSSGNNTGPWLQIIGWNGTEVASDQNLIEGNLDAGDSLPSSEDDLHIEDSTDDVITGNTVKCNSSSNCAYGINVTLNHAMAAKSTVTNNSVLGTFANGPINFGTSATVTFAANDENGASYSQFLNFVLPNNKPLNGYTTTSVANPLLRVNSLNGLDILSPSANAEINFVPGGSTISVEMTQGGLVAVGSQTVSGCSLTSALGGSWGGSFLSGTSGTCTVTITPGTTAPNGWTCDAHDLTTPSDVINQTAYNATTATISGTTASSDKITWKCVAF